MSAWATFSHCCPAVLGHSAPGQWEAGLTPVFSFLSGDTRQVVVTVLVTQPRRALCHEGFLFSLSFL